MKSVLVTGASGFVGQRLVLRLARIGHRVRAASRHRPPIGDDIEYVEMQDLSSSVDWKRLLEGIDVVVHASAIAHTRGIDTASYDVVNHKAVGILARAARGKVERIIFLSSIRAQSGNAASSVLDETVPARPTDDYGRSKLQAEATLAAAGTPYVVLRPVLVAGERPAGNLATLVRLARLPLPLPFASCTARRSLIDVNDLCGAIAHVMDDAGHLGQTYVAAHPTPIAIADMLRALRKGLGSGSGLLPFPPALLRSLATLAGLGNATRTLFEDLVVSPAKLMASGWTPRHTPWEALTRIGQEAGRARLPPANPPRTQPALPRSRARR